MRRTILITALLGLFSTTPALAEPHVWQTGDGFSIRATGLDLRTTDGRAALLSRVDAAVVKLCRDTPLRSDRQACKAETRAKAIAAAPGRARGALELAMREQEEIRLAAR